MAGTRPGTVGIDLNNDGHTNVQVTGPIGIDLNNDGHTDLVIDPRALIAALGLNGGPAPEARRTPYPQFPGAASPQMPPRQLVSRQVSYQQPQMPPPATTAAQPRAPQPWATGFAPPQQPMPGGTQPAQMRAQAPSLAQSRSTPNLAPPSMAPPSATNAGARNPDFNRPVPAPLPVGFPGQVQQAGYPTSVPVYHGREVADLEHETGKARNFDTSPTPPQRGAGQLVQTAAGDQGRYAVGQGQLDRMPLGRPATGLPQSPQALQALQAPRMVAPSPQQYPRAVTPMQRGISTPQIQPRNLTPMPQGMPPQSPPMPGTIGVDINRDGITDFRLAPGQTAGVDVNRDGITDYVVRNATAQPPQMMMRPQSPMPGTIGVDINRDGITDFRLAPGQTAGVDVNRDGITDYMVRNATQIPRAQPPPMMMRPQSPMPGTIGVDINRDGITDFRLAPGQTAGVDVNRDGITDYMVRNATPQPPQMMMMRPQSPPPSTEMMMRPQSPPPSIPQSSVPPAWSYQQPQVPQSPPSAPIYFTPPVAPPQIPQTPPAPPPRQVEAPRQFEPPPPAPPPPPPPPEPAIKVVMETRRGEEEILEFPYHDPHATRGCGFREVHGEFEDNIVERKKRFDEIMPAGHMISMTRVTRQNHGTPEKLHARPGFRYTGKAPTEEYRPHDKHDGIKQFDNGFPYHDPYNGAGFQQDHHTIFDPKDSDFKQVFKQMMTYDG